MMQLQLSDYLARDDAIDKSDLADAEQLLTRWRQADDHPCMDRGRGRPQPATAPGIGHLGRRVAERNLQPRRTVAGGGCAGGA